MTTSKARRVGFSGAQVIEYDASRAPVIKFCGVCRSTDADTLALECQARGLDSPTQLPLDYVQELQHLLRLKGFGPMSDDLTELQTQHQVLELLLTWTDQDTSKTEAWAGDVLDPATLQRAQLAKKLLEGRVDDGYAFGRRFFSVATYVETLSRDELVAAAKDRDVELPKLDEKQRAAVKAPDRELLGLYGTAEGRPLRSLTLRQLVTEAEERGMLSGEKARDTKGKKSKRAWVDWLRPVMVTEVRAAKIREKEEELLREKMVQVIEKEKEQEQKQRVVALIQAMMKRLEVGGDREPENDDTLESRKESENAYKYLEALVKIVCIPSEVQDVVMGE